MDISKRSVDWQLCLSQKFRRRRWRRRTIILKASLGATNFQNEFTATLHVACIQLWLELHVTPRSHQNAKGDKPQSLSCGSDNLLSARIAVAELQSHSDGRKRIPKRKTWIGVNVRRLNIFAIDFSMCFVLSVNIFHSALDCAVEW